MKYVPSRSVIWIGGQLVSKSLHTLKHPSLMENWQIDSVYGGTFLFSMMYSIADDQSTALKMHLKLGMEGVLGFVISLKTKCCFIDHV